MYERHSSSLPLPRERRIRPPHGLRPLCMAAPQQALLVAGGVVITDIVHLMFNAANGSQTFTDQGTAGSTWTASDANMTISTTNPKEGSACLNTAALTSDLGTSYGGANTITTGSYFCGLWFRPASIGINQAVFGVTDTTNTAAGTAFIVYVLSDNKFHLYYSNGSVLSNITIQSSTVSVGVWSYFSFYHQASDNAIYAQKDGESATTISGLTTLNVPTAKELRFGKLLSDNGPASGSAWDMCQMRRSIPAGIPINGALFTPPTVPWV